MRLWLAFGVTLTLSCGDQVVVRETPAACGNGEIEQNEQCDDGNEEPGDGCTDGCKIAQCGDGIMRADLSPEEDGYEGCDDGNDDPLDACLDDSRGSLR